MVGLKLRVLVVMWWKKSGVGIGLTDLTKIRGVSGTPSSTVPARAFKLRENLPYRLKVCFYIKVLP